MNPHLQRDHGLTSGTPRESAWGKQRNYGFEVHGTAGAVFWDFRRMGELGVCVGDT